MEFREFSNPEEANYDIKSSLDTNLSNEDNYNQYSLQLMDLIGILEDVEEEDLLNNYGITMQEYFNPTAETIAKVSEALKSNHKKR